MDRTFPQAAARMAGGCKAPSRRMAAKRPMRAATEGAATEGAAMLGTALRTSASHAAGRSPRNLYGLQEHRIMPCLTIATPIALPRLCALCRLPLTRRMQMTLSARARLQDLAAINAAMGLPADYTHNTHNTGKPLAGLAGGNDMGDGGDDVPVVQVCARAAHATTRKLPPPSRSTSSHRASPCLRSLARS